jgi:hypothetical protein
MEKVISKKEISKDEMYLLTLFLKRYDIDTADIPYVVKFYLYAK